MADSTTPNLTAVSTAVPATDEFAVRQSGDTRDKRMTLQQILDEVTGGVDTTGTPANNQLAIFTDLDTLEGDANVTWDGSLFSITGDMRLSGSGVAATPSYAFIDDIDTGMFLSGVGSLGWAVGGSVRMKLTAGGLSLAQSGSGGILNETASATNPTVNPNLNGDVDTGIGWAGADTFSVVTGAIEAARYTEVSSSVILANEAKVGLTADVGSAQGNGVILSS
ncbi:MAG: hypothetical protein V3T23_08485, partial [Nitrososphaerales archaeon]